jgi:hypothetical protein
MGTFSGEIGLDHEGEWEQASEATSQKNFV